MLRIVNTVKYLPTSYVVHPTDHFEPGMIGSITGKTATGYNICGRFNGSMPIGIIDDVRNNKDDSTLASQRITIWNEAITLQTDMFEHLGIYVPGNELGVSPKGLLSPALSDIRISGPVAEIVTGPTAVSGMVEFKWIPQIISHSLAPIICAKISLPKQPGMYCSKCNTLNQYIDVGNQPDGSYKCGPCRS